MSVMAAYEHARYQEDPKQGRCSVVRCATCTRHAGHSNLLLSASGTALFVPFSGGSQALSVSSSALCLLVRGLASTDDRQGSCVNAGSGHRLVTQSSNNSWLLVTWQPVRGESAPAISHSEGCEEAV